MKKFDTVKTVQLVLTILLACTALITILRDTELYSMIAVNPHVRLLAFVLWIVLGLSFLFLLYDFNSYSDLKRENLELDHAVYSDALTGIANRYSVDVYIGKFMNQPLPEDIGCVTIEITNLSEINAKLGHEGGDEAIQIFSDILRTAANGVCFIGRNGGNKFLAIFRECSEARLEKFCSSVEAQVQARNELLEVPLRYSAGRAFHEGDAVHTITELVALSDRRAWQNSGHMQNQI
ncbi:MAG: diguanylate cyclase [Solobacterium sp.]|nr:diguanylate cyclase [Solobacterium sp.]